MQNMKVLYDNQIFTNQQYGGISRYFSELIKRFDGIENSCNVSTLLSNNAYYNKEVNSKVNNFFPNTNFKGKGRIMRSINNEISKYALQKGCFDVFHPTYYDDYFFNNLKGKPYVVTFYDMIHEKFSNQFEDLKLDTKIFDNKKRLLEHSSKIIAISETTKKDLIEIFDVDSSNIDVVYLGNSLQNFYIGINRLVEEDYILFVGNRASYKNFNFFIKAIAQLLIDNDLKLICAGGSNFSQDELVLLKQLKLENRVIFKKILNDDVLANYYTNALFFCFPSLYEGFGIPVLETFACGCPALLSTGGSLPEVGGDAAFYFDPTDAESLMKSASELINNQSLRLILKEKGYDRLKEFSWERTFQDHLEVYKTVV